MYNSSGLCTSVDVPIPMAHHGVEFFSFPRLRLGSVRMKWRRVAASTTKLARVAVRVHSPQVQPSQQTSMDIQILDDSYDMYDLMIIL